MLNKILNKNKMRLTNSKTVVTLIAIIIFFLKSSLISTFPTVLAENFGSNIRVDDTGSDITNQTRPDIAILGNNIYVVWEDNRLSGISNTNIYFTKSIDNGISFNTNIRVDNAPIGAAASPSIAVDKSSGNIYVVWQDYRNSPDPYSVDVYFTSSTDGGNSFGANVRVISDTQNYFQVVPSIAVNNGLIGVVWVDWTRGIYFANSTDEGETFSTNKKVNDVIGSGFYYPEITIDDNGIIYVVWEDNIDGNFSIFFSKSVDEGNTWTPSKKVSDDPLSEGQRMPSIALDVNNNIYIAWRDRRGGYFPIFFAKSTNGGNTFSSSKQVDENFGNEWQFHPSIAVNDDSKIFVTWLNDREFPNPDNCCDVYFVNSTDGGNTFSTKQKINDGLSFSAVYSPSNAIAVNGSHAYVVWQDDRNGNWDIYFCRSYDPPPIEPPTNLSAELTGDNLENVTISWDASLDDPVNVTNYALYYSTNYNSNGLNYKFLTEVTASGTSKYYLTVLDIGEGDPNNYFFYVQANSTVGFSCARNDTQVSKFTKSLTTGIQLISIPLILNNTNISDVLRTLDYEVAWYYNNTDILDPWKSYNPSKLFNDLTAINRTMALWVNVTEDSNLTVAGLVPKITNIELNQGWNFVGYPSFIERTLAETLSGVNCERIEGYFQSSPEYLRIFSDDDFLTAGYGYWVKVNENAVWSLEN